MKLSSKITAIALTGVVLTALSGAFTVRWLAQRNRIDALHHEMSAVLSQARHVADGMDRMHRNQAFDVAKLLSAARAASGDRPLHDTYRETAFYDTIPIVAAWQTAEHSAESLGYTLFTPSHPSLTPRNPRNAAAEELLPAFTAFERGEPEYFHHDRESGEIILAQPVRITASCLSCHGDPASSPTGDGLDPLAFPMEGMKEGDIKGAFVLVAQTDHDAVIASTMASMAGVSMLVLVAIGGGLVAFNRRFVNRPLALAIEQIHRATLRTNGSVDQVAAASRELAEGASEQAASLEETSASVEEISGMTRKNAESASRTKQVAAETRAAADAGVEQMANLRASMESIHAASRDITHILKAIDDVAFQTNILALNAAVEAARAGAAGAGFAVVADEVRALAQRSAAAARETAAKVEQCVQRSEAGVVLTVETATQLATIQERIRSLDELAAELASSAQEQAIGLQQVSTAVVQVDQVTQQNARHAEEGAVAANALHEQTGQIGSAVGKLMQLLGRSTSPSDQPTPAPARLTVEKGSEATRPIITPSSARQSVPASPLAR